MEREEFVCCSIWAKRGGIHLTEGCLIGMLMLILYSEIQVVNINTLFDCHPAILHSRTDKSHQNTMTIRKDRTRDEPRLKHECRNRLSLRPVRSSFCHAPRNRNECRYRFWCQEARCLSHWFVVCKSVALRTCVSVDSPAFPCTKWLQLVCCVAVVS